VCAVPQGAPSRNTITKSRFNLAQAKVKSNVGCVIGAGKMVLHAAILPDDRFQHQVDQVLEVLSAQADYIMSVPSVQSQPVERQLESCREYMTEVIYVDDARRFSKKWASYYYIYIYTYIFIYLFFVSVGCILSARALP
jgi:hypothetical protein